MDTVASFGPDDVARLLGDASIVRHRGKINASIENARRFQQIRADHGSFHNYLAGLDDDPQALRRELRKRFLFMGPKIAGSFLESVGRIPAPSPARLLEGRFGLGTRGTAKNEQLELGS